MTEKKTVRHVMKITTSSFPLTTQGSMRNISTEDTAKLAYLATESYRGTIDQRLFTTSASLEQSMNEIQETFAGEHGPFLDFASFLIEDVNGIQSASIITLFREKPLIAYAMTLPESQGKGLAESLIRKSIDALAQHGYTELYLVVTEGNPAEKLYEKIGFVRCPPPEPKKPQPPKPQSPKI